MTRVAVFVDAGYLYAAGATALTDSKQNRTNMKLGQEEAIAKLEKTAKEQTNNVPLLRIYWYDGQVGGQPSEEQKSLANTDNIKVRLGFVTATGRQKGVDSLIVTDLIELARNHAISDAVLLSGDGDLRIAVQIAQSFGVRVHLVEIKTSEGNQSNLLKQEADTTKKWRKEDIEEILSIRSSTDLDPDTLHDKHSSSDSEDNQYEILDQVASEVAEKLDDNDLTTVYEDISQSPNSSIPQYHDKALLKAGKDKVGQWLGEPEKHYLRKRFKKVVCEKEKAARNANKNPPNAPANNPDN